MKHYCVVMVVHGYEFMNSGYEMDCWTGLSIGFDETTMGNIMGILWDGIRFTLGWFHMAG